jgi:hypothetical protein
VIFDGICKGNSVGNIANPVGNPTIDKIVGSPPHYIPGILITIASSNKPIIFLHLAFESASPSDPEQYKLS